MQKIARDSGADYFRIARRVNRMMSEGKGLQKTIDLIANENGLDPKKYKIKPLKIYNEVKSLLLADYSQTLMISAVMAQLVEAKGKDRLPVPAFLIFMEILSAIPDVPKKKKTDTPPNLDEITTRMIELTTTLVSVVCEWKENGVVGISSECPKDLEGIAKAVFRKIKLLQSGMWTCISCGHIIEAKKARSLMCETCDSRVPKATPSGTYRERDRTGYGKTIRGETID